MTRHIATVTPARSGGWLLSDGSAVPQWFADGRDADREANARNLISPTFVASGGKGVAGDHDPRTPAPHTPPDRSAA